MSHWPNLSHVPNTKLVVAAMRLEPTDWPIEDHYSALETSQPSCGEQLHRVWKKDGSSNICHTCWRRLTRQAETIHVLVKLESVQ